MVYIFFRLAISGIPAIIGLTIVLSTFGNLFESIEADGWARVDGVVIDGYTPKGWIAFTSYAFHNYDQLLYEYSFNAEDYSSSTIGYGIKSLSQRLYAGDSIRIYVNPISPEKSVIKAGISFQHVATIIFGVIILLASYSLWGRIKPSRMG